MITKVFFSVAIALAAAVAVATPASADPSSFGTLSCSCEQPGAVSIPDGAAPVGDQLDLGIRSGLAYLQGLPHPSDS